MSNWWWNCIYILLQTKPKTLHEVKVVVDRNFLWNLFQHVTKLGKNIKSTSAVARQKALIITLIGRFQFVSKHDDILEWDQYHKIHLLWQIKVHLCWLYFRSTSTIATIKSENDHCKIIGAILAKNWNIIV